MSRQSKIIKTSIIGITVNLILVAFKATIGILVNSIAITLDAVNNLTDAMSSIITIIGAKLANKPPDKQHPYGFGRIEYFSSVIIVAIVLWAGFTAFWESLPKIWNPDVTNYSLISLVIIAVAVAVKFALGRYVKGVGEDIYSQALIASGSDAYFDGILSFATLIGAIISFLWGISVEGILGVAISLVIMKAGIDMLRETIDSLIGKRIDSALSKKIKESVLEFPQVYGVYDLVLHNYGPESMNGSLHVKVDDTLGAVEIQKLSRQIAAKINKEFTITVTVGIYAKQEGYMDIQNDLDKICSNYEGILETHGFIVYEEDRTITVDMIVDFDYDREEIKNKVLEEIKAKYPKYDFIIIDDYDTSDINK